MNILRIFFLLSFVNFSFSQTTIYLESTACEAQTNAGSSGESSLTLIYTDSGTTGLDSSDTIDTASSDSSIDYSSVTTYYYYENSTLYSVVLYQDLNAGITSAYPNTATCSSGSGGGSPATIYLESTACEAQTNAGSSGESSLTLIYTDSGTTGLDSSDTIDTASSDSSIDFTSGGTEYFYYENGFIYSVSFTTIATLTFNPTSTTCTTETGTETGGLQNTYSVYTSISDACSQTGSTYDLIISSDPDNSLEIGDSVDNINSTVPSYSSESIYYFNDGSNVYSINFLDFPTGTYTINAKTLENCSPVISSSSTFESDENQTSVGTISATDFEDDTLIYSISGDDLAIVESTGIITFNIAPDYETQDVYTATITVSDGTSIDASQDITINVTDLDEIPPVITLTGDATVTIELGATYTDAGATATDLSGDITVTSTSTVDTDIVGSYTVTYTATDASGNQATAVVRTVNVVDTTAPVITLTGDATVTIELGATYTDEGATASDNYDGDITDSIVTETTVDTSVVGSYTVTYNVTDANSNDATTVTRIVNVVDLIIPILTLVGEDLIYIDQGSNYFDAGATALDNYDGDITENITVTGEVDTESFGPYTLIYDVMDSSGNVAISISRTVIVMFAFSVDEISNDKFVVYPNPTSSKWSIKSSVKVETVVLYDLLGRVVLSTKPMLNNFEINSNFLPDGVYMMVLNGKTSSKLIKKK